MPFTLEVRFEGLCLYVLHTDGNRAMVFMPDARLRPDENPRYHLGNKEKAEPHVGYVRLNLAHLAELPTLDPPLPEGVDAEMRAGPEYEVVHRFNNQVLRFGEPVTPEQMDVELAVPDFRALNPDLELRPDVFDAQQHDRVVLLRTSLEGGELRSVRTDGSTSGDRQQWIFEHPFGAVGDYEGAFDSSVIWRRTVDADALPVHITDLEGNVEASFSLRPLAPGGTVALKVANLCAVNPLEWEEMGQRSSASKVDNDFKWLYQLFRPKNGISWDEYLEDKSLPAPERTGQMVSANNDCMPANTRMSY